MDCGGPHRVPIRRDSTDAAATAILEVPLRGRKGVPSVWAWLDSIPIPSRASSLDLSESNCEAHAIFNPWWDNLSNTCHVLPKKKSARTSLCLRYLRDRLRLRGQSASGFSGELFPDAAGLLSPRVHSWCPPSFLSRPIARRARLLSVSGSISCCSRRTGAPHCCSCPSKNKHETLYLPPEMRGQCASALNGRPAYAPSFVCILGNRWIELVVVGWVCVSSRRNFFYLFFLEKLQRVLIGYPSRG